MGRSGIRRRKPRRHLPPAEVPPEATLGFAEPLTWEGQVRLMGRFVANWHRASPPVRAAVRITVVTVLIAPALIMFLVSVRG